VPHPQGEGAEAKSKFFSFSELEGFASGKSMTDAHELEKELGKMEVTTRRILW
jgi:hypothetical protein